MIKIEFHNPDLTCQFEKEAKLIPNALGENFVFINHIGSTAINQLESKPIIDIMPVERILNDLYQDYSHI